MASTRVVTIQGTPGLCPYGTLILVPLYYSCSSLTGALQGNLVGTIQGTPGPCPGLSPAPAQMACTCNGSLAQAGMGTQGLWGFRGLGFRIQGLGF